MGDRGRSTSPTPDEIRRLLQRADDLNEEARRLRMQAGEILYQMKVAKPGRWAGRCGVSRSTEEYLIEMSGTAGRFVRR